MGEAHAVTQFLTANTNLIALMLLGIGAIAGVIGGWRSFSDYLRGRAMKRKRQEEIHQLLAGGFTEFIEERIADGTLTRDEATEYGYLPLKRAYPTCKDLSTSANWLKERIEGRMKAKVHAPVVLPNGKKPNMFTINR